MSKREHDYFDLLPFMNQAKTHEERNRYYKKMKFGKGGGESKKLVKAQHEYYSNWFTRQFGKLSPVRSSDGLRKKLLQPRDKYSTLPQMTKKRQRQFKLTFKHFS